MTTKAPDPRHRLICFLMAMLLPGLALAQATRPALSPHNPDPTRVTLRLTNATLQEALDEISRQSAIAIRNAAGLEQDRITVDLRDVPFWEAMLKVAGKPQFSMQEDGSVTVRPSGTGEGQAIVSGPFLLLARRITAAADFTRGESPRQTLIVQVSVMPEPRLAVLSALPSRPEQAEDEKGLSLVPAGAGAQVIVPVRGQRVLPCVIELHAAPEAGRRIAILKGTLPIQICAKIERIEIDKPTFGAFKKKVAGVDVFVDPLRPDGTMYGTAVGFRRGDLSEPEWAGVVNLMDAVHVSALDDGGRPWRLASSRRSTRSDACVQLLQFSRAGAGTEPPRKLVVDMPAETRTLQVPYEFRDLPRP